MLTTQEPTQPRTSVEEAPPTSTTTVVQDWGAQTVPDDDTDTSVPTSIGHDDRGPGDNDAESGGPDPAAVAYMDFETMGLPEQLLRGIYAFGFEVHSIIASPNGPILPF